MPRLLRGSLALSLLTACPKDTPADSDASTSSAGATDTGTSAATTGVPGEPCAYPGSTSDAPLSPDLAPECACADPDDGDLLCASPICPRLTGVFHPLDPQCIECDEGTWTYDDAALACALAAARDGAEGTLTWYLSPDSGYTGHEGYLHILPGRRVLRQTKEWADLGGTASATDLWQLRDAAYFAACLALESPCQRVHCLFAGTTGPAVSRCAPAYAYTP